MMTPGATSGKPALKDVAVLTRVVENVFRKMIRMLIGRMSLKKLQRLIQVIFVEEAEAVLKRESPGSSVALGDIALLTGVDTRTIKKVRAHIATSEPMHQDQDFLDGFMPLFKVFDIWMNDPRFFDSSAGKPRTLAIEGQGHTFSELIGMTIQSRGLTARAVLKRLKETGVVRVDRQDGTVKLRQEDNVFISPNELDLLDVGFTAIGQLAGTVSHNIENHLDDRSKYFQRGSWNYQFSPQKMDEVRRAIHEYLQGVDRNSRELITSLAEDDSRPGQWTAGIGMFYFEEAAES